MDRAVIRTSAIPAQGLEDNFDGQSSEVFYPIPDLNSDTWTGTGVASADYLQLFCQASSVTDTDDGSTDYKEIITDAGEGDNSNWSTAPNNVVNTSTSAVNDSSKQNSTSRDDSDHRQYPVPLKLGNNLEVQLLKSYLNVKKNDRIRFSLSYWVCNGFIGIDYDLIACPENGDCVVASQALNDPNEGFDYTFKNDFNKINVYIVKEKEAMSFCTNSGNEPFSYAGMMWRRKDD